ELAIIVDPLQLSPGAMKNRLQIQVGYQRYFHWELEGVLIQKPFLTVLCFVIIPGRIIQSKTFFLVLPLVSPGFIVLDRKVIPECALFDDDLFSVGLDIKRLDYRGIDLVLLARNAGIRVRLVLMR